MREDSYTNKQIDITVEDTRRNINDILDSIAVIKKEELKFPYIYKEMNLEYLKFDKFKTIEKFGIDYTSSIHVWTKLIEKYKDYRQGFREGSRYGRSLWPEADEIRRLTMRFKDDIDIESREDELPRKFPRAEFGLPINFQFREDDVNDGDPEQTMLFRNKDMIRLGSPLIFRPIYCSDGILGVYLCLGGRKN